MQDTIHTEIKRLLDKIRENSKKMKSKMSKPLLELEEFARANIAKMQNSDAELLLLGEGKAQGLIRLSSTRKKFAEGFKKSAYTAFKVLLNLLEMDATPVVQNVFFALEEDAYEQLLLGDHISSAEENSLTALQIARKIKVFSEAKTAFFTPEKVHRDQSFPDEIRRLDAAEFQGRSENVRRQAGASVGDQGRSKVS